MIFPVGDDQVKGGYFPLFSYGFILINIAIFLFQLSLNGDQLTSFVDYFGNIPIKTLESEDLFTLLTSLFLHGGWMHLVGNMLFLWVFADNIEATIGNLPFLLFYILGGLAAHAAHIYFNQYSDIPTIGASGAISAVMGAYLIMFPLSRIRVWVLIFPLRVSAFIFLGLWIAQQWISGTAALEVGGQGSGVAWWAHIGGFAFGIIAGIFFRLRYKKKEEPMAYDELEVSL